MAQRDVPLLVARIVLIRGPLLLQSTMGIPRYRLSFQSQKAAKRMGVSLKPVPRHLAAGVESRQLPDPAKVSPCNGSANGVPKKGVSL